MVITIAPLHVVALELDTNVKVQEINYPLVTGHVKIYGLEEEVYKDVLQIENVSSPVLSQDEGLVRSPDDGPEDGPEDEGLVRSPEDGPEDEGLVRSPEDEGLVRSPEDEGLVRSPEDGKYKKGFFYIYSNIFRVSVIHSGTLRFFQLCNSIFSK
jgi:hypothetical protein